MPSKTAMPSQPPKPPVVRAATLEETRFLMSVILNNSYGLTDGVYWDSVAVEAGLGFQKANLAAQMLQQIKLALSHPLPAPKLEDASLEELDKMIAAHGARGEELGREREMKVEMRGEEEKLALEERGLRERKDTLRMRTEARLKRKRGVEGGGEGGGDAGADGEGEVKAEEEEEERKVKKEKLEILDD